MKEYAERRKKLADQMQNNSVVILPAAQEQYRNGDVTYPFRQDSNFLYLTGYPEPNAILMLIKDNKGNLRFVLFNEANDPVAAVWNGPKIGQAVACSKYNADEAHDIAEIDTVLPRLLANKQIIYFPLARINGFDQRVGTWVNAAWKLAPAKDSKDPNAISHVPSTFIDVWPMLSELRILKSENEIAQMRKAIEVSALAHTKLMQTCKPDLYEYQLEAVFNEFCLQHGCRGFAYNAIVAGGKNGCTLHYVANDQKLHNGDLVLVDAGAEYDGYAADITRTFPVNGKFSPEQRAIYELVLKAQLAGIDQVRPGNHFDAVQDVIVEIIVAGLLELGILKGNAKQIIQEKMYKQIYMHSSGHWLGLDVHDLGKYRIDNKSRILEPGMVLTVEPGIYLSESIVGLDPKWVGIAVRIEDDVLVTKNGNEVLSIKAPKTVSEIERIRL